MCAGPGNGAVIGMLLSMEADECVVVTDASGYSRQVVLAVRMRSQTLLLAGSQSSQAFMHCSGSFMFVVAF